MFTIHYKRPSFWPLNLWRANKSKQAKINTRREGHLSSTLLQRIIVVWLTSVYPPFGCWKTLRWMQSQYLVVYGSHFLILLMGRVRRVIFFVNKSFKVIFILIIYVSVIWLNRIWTSNHWILKELSYYKMNWKIKMFKSSRKAEIHKLQLLKGRGCVQFVVP